MNRPWAHIITLTVTVMITVGAGSAAAATLTVNTTSDNSQAGDGACSLREAIAAVDSPGTAGRDCKPAAFGANTIVIPSGTYTVSSYFDPITQKGGEFVIAPTVTRLTIVGAGEAKTTIAASRVLFDRLLKISSGATVTIKDLTLTGGRAAVGNGGTGGNGGAAGAGANGGAILNGGSLTLIDSAVTNSRAGDGGSGGFGAGAIANGGAGGTGGSGGGIYNTGLLTLQGSTIAGNSAGSGGPGGPGGNATTTGGIGGAGGAGGEGGGVANGGGTLTVVDSTFKGNDAGEGGHGGDGGSGPTGGNGGSGGSASGGGGIVSTGGTMSITDSTLASNSAGDGSGGGNGGGPNPGGSAGSGGNGGGGGDGGSGGGVDLLGVGNSSLQSATIAGNNAGAGGAGGNGSPAGADGTAGSAGAGGGIASQGVATTLQNSLLASNGGGNCSGSASDSGHNLSFAGTGCPPTFATGDPNLGPLQNNGGPVQTISLGVGSAAIDKVPSSGAGCPATDERGVSRPVGSGCDIGAYELAPPTASTGRTKSVTASSATVTGSVTPNAGGVAVYFQFGTNRKYKSKSAIKHSGGVAPVTMTVTLRHLRPRTTYHYRVVIVGPDGTSVGRDRTFRTRKSSSHRGHSH